MSKNNTGRDSLCVSYLTQRGRKERLCVLATGAQIRSSSAAQLTYFHHNGKLHPVNADHNDGLQGIASVYHDRISANGQHMDPNAMTAARSRCQWAAGSRSSTSVTAAL
jgi:rare lipoprotein A (peptidoglycan hydrolase)